MTSISPSALSNKLSMVLARYASFLAGIITDTFILISFQNYIYSLGLTLGLIELLGLLDGDSLGEAEILLLGLSEAEGLALGEAEGLAEIEAEGLMDGLILADGLNEGE